ncbi:MAG: DUF4421 domain-containing protein [Bacteroidales bacterium]|nr:DUF4421 domain-containing protein [Bacteroidales bacterium]
MKRYLKLIIFVLDADSSIVLPEISGDFESKLHLADMNSLRVAFSLRYMYTLVFKKHFS